MSSVLATGPWVGYDCFAQRSGSSRTPMMFKKKKRAESALVLGLGGIGSYLGQRLVHEG